MTGHAREAEQQTWGLLSPSEPGCGQWMRVCLADRSEKGVAPDRPRANVSPWNTAGAWAPSPRTGGGVQPPELPEGHAHQLSTEAPALLPASLQSKHTSVVAPGTSQTWTLCPFVPVRGFVAVTRVLWSGWERAGSLPELSSGSSLLSSVSPASSLGHSS